MQDIIFLLSGLQHTLNISKGADKTMLWKIKISVLAKHYGITIMRICCTVPAGRRRVWLRYSSVAMRGRGALHAQL